MRPSLTAGALASLGSLSLVVSMDRLLRYCLQQFIRRGAMNFTTASGAKFSCGDGTGQPVSVRFLTAEAERRVLLNPELALRRSLHGRQLRRRGRLDRRRAGDPDGSARDGAALGQTAGWAALSVQASQAAQSRAAARKITSRITTISTDGCIRSSSMPTSNIAAPISRRRTQPSTMRSSPRSAILPQSSWSSAAIACSTSAAAGADLSLYLAEMTGASVTGVTLSTEQLQVANARAAEKNLTAQIFPRGLSRRRRAVRPHRVGGHVRACRRRLLRNLFQALRRTSHRRWRDAAALDRPVRGSRRHQSLDCEIYLPRRLHPGAVRGHAGDRARRACWSATPKSCGCITPRP